MCPRGDVRSNLRPNQVGCAAIRVGGVTAGRHGSWIRLAQFRHDAQDRHAATGSGEQMSQMHRPLSAVEYARPLLCTVLLAEIDRAPDGTRRTAASGDGQ